MAVIFSGKLPTLIMVIRTVMFVLKNTIRKLLFFHLLLSLSLSGRAQSHVFGGGTVNWETRKPYKMPVEAERCSGADLVVLEDYAEFQFYSPGNEILTRNTKYKINTQKGLDELKHFKTPETFDYGFDSELYKRGRRARIKIPFIRDYNVRLFAARRFSNNRWSNVPVKDKYETLRWIKSSGEFADADMLILQLGSLAIGDVVEIYYEAEFNTQYGSNIFYFNGRYPKLKCEYDFIYRVEKSAKDINYIRPVNLDSIKLYNSKVDYTDYDLVTTKIQLDNLPANNYPLNSFESEKLPHVFADFGFYRSRVMYSNNRYVFARNPLAKNFEWVVSLDTTVGDQTRIYDKQFASIRKFTATLPQVGNDSQNVVFFRSLCDTFNNFRYLSPNHLYYNESNLYELYSGEHLLKRRLPGHTAWKLYADILRDNNLFYYLVNIQDKRFGEHDRKWRTHYAYEHNLIALPINDSYIYFMPRSGGLKYHLNELPFYHEGALAALSPMNFQADTKNKGNKVFKMIKTHRGTFNENTRTENATVRVSLDSLRASLSIKESLSGQFSTILRHLYLNELIDSTIAPHYFRKCLDKPHSSGHKIKLSSRTTEFPYRYNFACAETITLSNTTVLDFRNWFSFLLNKRVIPEPPNFDYYFDFDFSDSYRFLLDFDTPVDVKNAAAFSKKITNAYFELESGIVANADNSFLVSVDLIVKQTSIPASQASLLTELVEELEKLNNFSLELAKR